MSVNEEWTNVGEGIKFVPHTLPTGQIRNMLIRSGQTFKVKAEDRQYFQAHHEVTPEGDHYTNGTFQPVKLVEDAVDYAEISDSKNHLNDEELLGLIKGRTDAVSARIAEIDNPDTLARLLVLCEEKDTAGSKVKVIESRYAELTAYVTEGLEDGMETEQKIS